MTKYFVYESELNELHPHSLEPSTVAVYAAKDVDAILERLKDERDYALGSRDQWEVVAKDRQLTVNDLRGELELAKSMNARLRQAPHQWLPSASDQEREEY